MDKMKKTAVRLDVFFNVLQVACVVAAVAAGVALVMIAACLIFRFDPEKIGTGYNILDIGFLELEVAEAFAPGKHRVLVIGAVDMAMSVILALLGRSCVASVRRLLAPMKEGQPFASEISKNLRKLGWLSLILGVAVQVMEAVSLYSLFIVQNMDALLISEKITHVDVNVSFDPSFLIIPAVFFLLAYVFKYGEQLQTLSDETL